MVDAESISIPLLRVSRPVSACQRCRGAKIKCDGKLPACTACERAGRSDECSSASDQFAKGKERSYVASLETRIERLERQISQARGRRVSVDMLGTAPTTGFFPPDLRYSTRSRNSDRQEASSVDDLVSDFGFLSVNATARDFHGFTGEMSFAKLVLSTSSLEAIPVKTIFTLPQRYEITPLIQHYLENVHVVYPLLLETGLFASIDAVYRQGGLYANPIDHWVTLMVLAISCASLARRRGDPHYQNALDYAAAASNYVEKVIQPGSIFGIQAMLLMVLLAMWAKFDGLIEKAAADYVNVKLPHHYNSWCLIGVASRAAIDLGLHQDTLPELHVTTSERYIRLRVFGCVYSLDRSISMVNQRAFSFTDDSTDIATRTDELPNPPKLQSPFSFGLKPATNLVKLRRIQSSFYQRVFQSERLPIHVAWPIMCEAIHDMEQWYSSLQAQVNEALRHHAYCEVLFSNILVLTPPDWIHELPKQGKFLLFKYAQEYADNISSSINNVSEVSGFYTSHDLLRASFVAQRFVKLLQVDHHLLLSESIPSLWSGAPEMDATAGLTTPWVLPELLTCSGNDISGQLHRIYDCLGHFETAIQYFGSKYGFTDPLHEYQMDSIRLKQTLKGWAGRLKEVKTIPYS